MLGELVGGLTNAATAEQVVATIGKAEILARIQQAAAAEHLPVGALVASKVRHVVEHGGEDIWLDLLGVMSGSAQPGAAAIERVLAYAFPDPVRVRFKRAAS